MEESDREILIYDETAQAAAKIAAPVCRAEGLELVHVEYQREPAGRILRFYIDKIGGVTLDDCVVFSRQLGDILDVGLEVRDAYHLEVTSPGPNRPLSRASDFERFKGAAVRVRTVQPIEGQKNFSGLLLGLANGQVNLEMNHKAVAIPLTAIAKARLVDYDGAIDGHQ